MSENKRVRYYTNPAFCQQSEYYPEQQPINTPPPPITTTLKRCSSMREAPIGANSSPQKFERHSSLRYPAQTRTKLQQYEMDENEIRINQQVISQLQMTDMNINQNRYAYIPNTGGYQTKLIERQRVIQQHRYEMIPSDEEEEEEEEMEQIRELSPSRVFYTTSPVDYNGNTPPRPVPAPRRNIPIKSPPIINQTIVKTVQSTHTTPTPNIHSPPVTPQKKYNPIATQKLQELIITPRKTPTRAQSFHSPNYRAKSPPPVYPGPLTPHQTPHKQPPYVSPPLYHPQYRQQVVSPRAQQKLQYTPKKEYPIMDVRNTAVIQPLRPVPTQSVYSETTLSGKSSDGNSSWMNLSIHKDNSSATLAVAALMMILCGALTSGFCFYMISVVGRKYYLDFALVAGFTCFVLGLLGFRTRSCRWLPNRNYISGKNEKYLFSAFKTS